MAARNDRAEVMMPDPYTDEHSQSGSACRHMCWVILTSHDHELRRWRVAAMIYVLFSCGLIVTLFVLDVSDTSEKLTNKPLYYSVERVACAVFSSELVLRLWSCVEGKDPRDTRSDFHFRLRNLFSFLTLMDVVTLVALFIDLFTYGGSSSRALSIFRVIRLLFVVNRLNRDFMFFNIVVNVLTVKRHELLVAVNLAICMLLLSSTLMVYIEGDDPDSPLRNWFNALWWASAALTTVGYGDVKPETDAGKMLAIMVAFCGVGLFALPAGILASGFNEVLESADPTKTLSSKRWAEQAVQKSRASVVAIQLDAEVLPGGSGHSTFEDCAPALPSALRPQSSTGRMETQMISTSSSSTSPKAGAGLTFARLDSLIHEVSALREQQNRIQQAQEEMLSEQRRSNAV